MRYVCKKEFIIPYQDEDGFTTDKYGTVTKDSVWDDYDNAYIGESDIRLLQETDSCEFGYIDISNESIEEYFNKQN